MIDYESLLNHEIKAVKPSGIRKFFDMLPHRLSPHGADCHERPFLEEV